ncbi:hypothetical protein MRX96_014585 [Rhipicephalus microplus]
MMRQRHSSVATGIFVLLLGRASNGGLFRNSWRLRQTGTTVPLQDQAGSPGFRWSLDRDDPAGVRPNREAGDVQES